MVEVGHFSGAARPSPSDAPTVGTTTTAYDAEHTTVTDPANKKRRSKRDGMGRLVEVHEPPANGNLEATVTRDQKTEYGYNALDNLTRVTQFKSADGPQNPAVTQTRTFTYDSLSRLTSASKAGSGTIAFSTWGQAYPPRDCPLPALPTFSDLNRFFMLTLL